MENLHALAKQKLQEAQSVTVLTGAGISAESGIPTFRDQGGIWDQFDPQKVATPEAFARDPAYVWQWYQLRMEHFQRCQPNAGHQALVTLEQETQFFTLLTQNIDNLHRLAGSQNVVELHGNIWQSRCTVCGDQKTAQGLWKDPLPKCIHCNSLLRPDVVWFGEALNPAHLQQAESACHCDIFLVVGTSGEVWPAAGLAHHAKMQGAYLIEINTQFSELSQIVDLSLLGPAGQNLPLIVGKEA